MTPSVLRVPGNGCVPRPRAAVSRPGTRPTPTGWRPAVAAPHGTPRCTADRCPSPGVIRDDQDRPWCAADYALIFTGVVDNYRRFLIASVRTLARAA